jgi:hypothetical protein
MPARTTFPDRRADLQPRSASRDAWTREEIWIIVKAGFLFS